MASAILRQSCEDQRRTGEGLSSITVARPARASSPDSPLREFTFTFSCLSQLRRVTSNWSAPSFRSHGTRHVFRTHNRPSPIHEHHEGPSFRLLQLGTKPTFTTKHNEKDRTVLGSCGPRGDLKETVDVGAKRLARAASSYTPHGATITARGETRKASKTCSETRHSLGLRPKDPAARPGRTSTAPEMTRKLPKDVKPFEYV